MFNITEATLIKTYNGITEIGMFISDFPGNNRIFWSYGADVDGFDIRKSGEDPRDLADFVWWEDFDGNTGRVELDSRRKSTPAGILKDFQEWNREQEAE